MRPRAALVLLFVAGAFGQAPALDTAKQERIVREVSAAMSRDGIPAFSLAVAHGAERWAAAWGLADLENFVPATPRSLFRVGSVSKPMTAVAAMQLAEQGRLDPDAPVERYCPAFPAKAKPVSVRQLLGHLGGVRHYRGGEFVSTRLYSGVAESLEIFKDDPLVHDPGSAYLYSSYGYSLAGCAVEGASGEPFVAYLARRIWQPAGMTHTAADEVGAILAGRVRGYTRGSSDALRNAPLADLSHKLPGGGVVSTPEDLVRFGVALLEDRLLRPETRRQMWTSMKLDTGRETSYGAGWGLGGFDGLRDVSHTGSAVGALSVLYLIPEKNLTLAFAFNLDQVRMDRLELARKIARIVLEQPEKP